MGKCQKQQRMARHAAAQRLKKADEEQGQETTRYKWGEIEEEIAVLRGAAGYNSDEEEGKWAGEIARRRSNGFAAMDTDWAERET